MYYSYEALKPTFLDEESTEFDSSRVKSNGFIYLVDNKDIYLQGRLSMPLQFHNECFTWILWVKMPAKDFLIMSENMKGEHYKAGGKIYTPIYFYDDMEDLEIELIFKLKENDRFPDIIILDNHKLLLDDFTNGVSLEKFKKWQNIWSDS